MIKEYGVINRFTTETYETLHKDAVKNPYRASNKRQPTDQMIKTVSNNILLYHGFYVSLLSREYVISNDEIAITYSLHDKLTL